MTSERPVDRVTVAVLWLVPFVFAGIHLARGAGYVLDDWFVLRNATLDGAWSAAGGVQGAARPGSYPVFALAFGAFGDHPLPGMLLLATLTAATGHLTVRLLMRFVPRGIAVVAALLWVVLPTHTATSHWLTCSILAVSQLCLVAALTLAARTDRSTAAALAAWLLLASSVATYEASLPLAAAAAVAVPWLVGRRFDVTFTLGAAGAIAVPALWILVNWYDGKEVQGTADPAHLLLVNFGWGITPDGADSPLVVPLVLVATIGVAAAIARLLLPSFEATTADRLVVAGLLVMVIGFLPFLRYYYEPQGAGDRANYLSAVGGAMVWAGLAWMVARVHRHLATGAVAVLLVLGTVARLERIEVWSTAGTDAQAIADAVVDELPPDADRVVLGPEPIVRWNVAAFLDASNIQGAVDVGLGRRGVEATISYDAEAWAALPEDERFDIRGPSKLDELDVLE